MSAYIPAGGFLCLRGLRTKKREQDAFVNGVFTDNFGVKQMPGTPYT